MNTLADRKHWQQRMDEELALARSASGSNAQIHALVAEQYRALLADETQPNETAFSPNHSDDATGSSGASA